MEALTEKRINDAALKHTKRYNLTEKALEEVFKHYPDHKNVQGVIAKIALLDRLYATNLSKATTDIVDFAQKICGIHDTDIRLQCGDVNLVCEISQIVPTKKPFSFATKYCCLHNIFVYQKDDYSIVDSHVKNYLPQYLKDAKKSGLKVDYISRNKLEYYQKTGNYSAIADGIESLLNEYKILLPNRRRAFDTFIWLQGKGICF